MAREPVTRDRAVRTAIALADAGGIESLSMRKLAAELGVEAAFSVDTLDEKMPALLANRNAVWFPFATHKGLETQIDGWLTKVRARVRLGAECPQSQHDLCKLLDEMRLIKDAHEIAILRREAATRARRGRPTVTGRVAA